MKWLVMLKGYPGSCGMEPLKRKFASLLEDLEKKKFDDEVRNFDVFFLGHKWGEHFEQIRHFSTAEAFYTGALRAGDCPTGQKALSKIYGKRDMIPVIQQYCALLYKKQMKLDRAEKMYFQILDTPGVCLAMSNLILHQLSTLYASTGDVAKLKNTHKRWKKLLTAQNVPVETLIYAQYLESRADQLRRFKDFKEAAEYSEKVLAIHEKAYGKDSWLLTIKLGNLARIYKDQLKYDKAYAQAERAYKICSQLRELTQEEMESGSPLVPFL